MANHTSAKKSIRQTLKRTEENRSRMSRIRTLLRKVDEAIESKDKVSAQAAFAVAQPVLARSLKHNAFHKNTMARKISRLSARIKAI